MDDGNKKLNSYAENLYTFWRFQKPGTVNWPPCCFLEGLNIYQAKRHSQICVNGEVHRKEMRASSAQVFQGAVSTSMWVDHKENRRRDEGGDSHKDSPWEAMSCHMKATGLDLKNKEPSEEF